MKPEQIRAFRARNGLTQQALAQHLGVSLRAVTWWEAGKRQPAPYLARALNHLEAELTTPMCPCGAFVATHACLNPDDCGIKRARQGDAILQNR